MAMVRSFTGAPDVVTVGVVHDLNLAARFADQIVLLDRGQVVAVSQRRSDAQEHSRSLRRAADILANPIRHPSRL